MSIPISVLLRNALFHAASLVLSGIFLCLAPAGLLWPRLGHALTAAYLQALQFLLAAICGIRFVVRGAERIPQGPSILAAAQQSTWENLFFPRLFGDPAMIMKNEILGYPLIASIAKRRGYIAAHRGGTLQDIRASLDEARRQTLAGRSILVFPTGMRTGTRKNPALRRGIAALYQHLDIPCVPIAHNSGLYWRHESWLRLPGTIVVEVLEPIEPGLAKKQFLETLQRELIEAANDLLEPSRPPDLMPRPTPRARAISERIAAGRGAVG